MAQATERPSTGMKELTPAAAPAKPPANAPVTVAAVQTAPVAAAPVVGKKRPQSAVGVFSKSRVKRARQGTRPKNSRSAYVFFVMERRANLTKEETHLTFSEVAQKIGRQWRTMSAEEKKKYDQRAFEDRKRYQREKAQWAAEMKESRRAEQINARNQLMLMSRAAVGMQSYQASPNATQYWGQGAGRVDDYQGAVGGRGAYYGLSRSNATVPGVPVGPPGYAINGQDRQARVGWDRGSYAPYGPREYSADRNGYPNRMTYEREQTVNPSMRLGPYAQSQDYAGYGHGSGPQHPHFAVSGASYYVERQVPVENQMRPRIAYPGGHPSNGQGVQQEMPRERYDVAQWQSVQSRMQMQRPYYRQQQPQRYETSSDYAAYVRQQNLQRQRWHQYRQQQQQQQQQQAQLAHSQPAQPQQAQPRQAHSQPAQPQPAQPQQAHSQLAHSQPAQPQQAQPQQAQPQQAQPQQAQSQPAQPSQTTAAKGSGPTSAATKTSTEANGSVENGAAKDAAHKDTQ